SSPCPSFEANAARTNWPGVMGTTPMVRNLDETQKLENRVFLQVGRSLVKLEPNLFRPGERWKPAGMHELAMHLPHLLEIARRVSSTNDDLYTSVRETVCSDCMHQTPGGYCHQRRNCVLQRHAPTIIQAIRI